MLLVTQAAAAAAKTICFVVVPLNVADSKLELLPRLLHQFRQLVYFAKGQRHSRPAAISVYIMVL